MEMSIIKKSPLLKKNLVDFETNNRIINRFEEILRHNNVSDKENAFNRLTALFISKLADENGKADGAEVEFQYKIGTDDIESLQDRLQRLYSIGMEHFMREKIFYVPNDYVEKALSTYFGQRRGNLIEELNRTMRQLKFYTNNEFAFKEIHNEKLFRQNGKILIEVVQLFERYRLIGAKNLQLLGDLFEQLLNKGFKQNEGQFFTPIPIARFIWDSLPLSSTLRAEDGIIHYPRIIDYACGAGHFLTQGYEAINDRVRADFDVEPSPDWVSTKLYGIEKDYRLSRVSKISLFMHGAGLGNIVFGDGLDDHLNFDFGKEIVPGRFDILTANPPYAVAAFKRHLKEETRNNFSIIDKISNDGSEIETLFIERAAQLLRPLGLAAIILPSSILNKDNASFIAARELLIKRFMIRAIVRLGGKTFSATSTNTNIFFLQKFDEPLRRDLSVEDSVDAIFDWREDKFAEWEDKNILDSWLEKIDIDRPDYKNFVLRAEHFDRWKDHKHFGAYYDAFVASNTYTKKIAQPSFKKLSEAEQIEEIDRLFYLYAHPIEREKLWCFGCTYNRTTLIITAPDDNKGQETFLGYKWSNRKGAEGMQTIKAGGLLYDPSDRRAEDRLAALVRAAYEERELELDGLKDYYYYLPTHAMLNFKGVDFNRRITPEPDITDIERKFPTVRLEDVIDFNPKTLDPSTTPEKIYHYVEIGSINKNIIDYSKTARGDKISDSARRLADENGATMRGSLYPSLSQKDIRDLKILLPSIEVQRSIVAEFDAIDEQFRAEDRIIRDCDKKINAAFNEMFAVYAADKNIPFDAVIVDDTRNGFKFERSEYRAGGDVPIIDQSPTPVAGYRNVEIGKPPYKNLPCIVFGDHSETFKLATEKFYLGADGTKILIPADRDKADAVFMFHQLKREYKPRGRYERHYKYLRETKLFLPPIERQREFAALVRSLDSARSAALDRQRALQSERDRIINRYFR